MTSSLNHGTHYREAARRHLFDGDMLFDAHRKANAGQLYGFVAECGMKALLVACGVPEGADGGIADRTPAGVKIPFRKHMPFLWDNIVSNGVLIPDGALSAKYMAHVQSLICFDDWSVDHRYWEDNAFPHGSLVNWRSAAHDVAAMLDMAVEDGVIG
jgi:hypothetical protein